MAVEQPADLGRAVVEDVLNRAGPLLQGRAQIPLQAALTDGARLFVETLEGGIGRAAGEVDARTRGLAHLFDERLGVLGDIVVWFSRRPVSAVERSSTRAPRVAWISSNRARSSCDRLSTVCATCCATLGALVDERSTALTGRLENQTQALATVFDERMRSLDGLVESRGGCRRPGARRRRRPARWRGSPPRWRRRAGGRRCGRFHEPRR
jgi:hypothetical protein